MVGGVRGLVNGSRTVVGISKTVAEGNCAFTPFYGNVTTIIRRDASISLYCLIRKGQSMKALTQKEVIAVLRAAKTRRDRCMIGLSPRNANV
jgi:hypothetical protein